MQIEAKDIEGFISYPEMPEKLCPEGDNCSSCSYMDGMKDALDLISQKKLEVVIDFDAIERIIWKYCSPFYEKDIEGHTHTLKADEAIKEIIHSANTDKGLVRIELVKESL